MRLADCAGGGSSLERVARLWWVSLPAWAGKLSQSAGTILLDGAYLRAWPIAAAVAPQLAFLVGLLIGWFHFTPGATFTFSIVLMSIMLAIASLGAGLGAWLWLGYVVGDFVLYSALDRPPLIGESLEQLVRVRLALVLSYLLLGALLTFVPLACRSLARQTLGLIRRFRVAYSAAEAIVLAVLRAALVLVWVESVPSLIRPVYTWSGDFPPKEAMQPLQETGLVFVVFGALGGIVRVVAEFLATRDPELRRQIAQPLARPAVRLSLPPIVTAVLRAIATTFMLSGLLAGWFDAVALGVALAVLLSLRSIFLPRLRPWVAIVTRIPLVLRLVAGV